MAASLCREVQSNGNFKRRVREALEDQKARIERLEAQMFGNNMTIVNLKIENSVDSFWTSAEYNVSVRVGITVFEMMQRATKQFEGDFTFTYTYFSKLGNFIDSINGLAGSVADQTYWRFENRNGVGFDRGVDWILVHYDDAFIFRFT
ncbi:DUF4430 domain-containing protein, partial [Klebsiella pneumoniae]